jgi:uracil-DNA glycosylase
MRSPNPPTSAPTPTRAAARDRQRQLDRLQQDHRACRRCVDAGWLGEARPVFSGHAEQRVMIVGQAPGPVEHDAGRPFSGRAGRQLMRWLQRAGFPDEDDARARIYFISATTCFPGRRPDGAGDRRPTPREVDACSPWREAAMRLVDPPLVLPVGSLALSLLLPGARLDECVGRALLEDGSEAPDDPRAVPLGRRILLPLPHPSGQSRWLNDHGRAALLDRALDRLTRLVPWAEQGACRVL